MRDGVFYSFSFFLIRIQESEYKLLQQDYYLNRGMIYDGQKRHDMAAEAFNRAPAVLALPITFFLPFALLYFIP